MESRGKWLLIHFTGDLILVTHMLMSGSWHIYRRGERWRRTRIHMRAVIATNDFEAVAFDVPVASFHTARTLERNTSIPKLGPDLLQGSFSEDEAIKRLVLRGEEEVANVLLNQQVLAGIGNVFKSEICFSCGVSPFTRVSALSSAQVECLMSTARRLLAANVSESAGPGIVTYSGGRRTTGAADPGARLWVYGRRGKQCRRCGTIILMRKQGVGARSTYWCPQCQPLPLAANDGGGGEVEGWSTPVRRTRIGCS
ncbi:Formamidopyrimidine-DNA glycosylase [Acidisarcina polymorpha]|uniref:DNA-(apurinic or apyrimidinic site) lyase n=1 Tax=Acidisarcina polymorpha TaxID=2211140 RepID=A0A2Z5G5Z4_9BACT|nr:Formamidopyrimidine-DNA glycosylase [Acidisarcina polymorpha]